jgi:Ni/Co efflux regulator RcnB
MAVAIPVAPVVVARVAASTAADRVVRPALSARPRSNPGNPGGGNFQRGPGGNPGGGQWNGQRPGFNGNGGGNFQRGPENRGPDNRGPDNRGGFNQQGRPGFDGGRPGGPDFNRPGRPDGPSYNGRPGAPGYNGRPGGPGYNQPGRPGGPGFNGPGRPGGGWNNGWRNDNRYNWSAWRDMHRDVFRMGRYRPPYSGYAYRRLGIGFTLDRMFFGSTYVLADPYAYRLPPAYEPYEWVRYYNDAVLVDTYTGQVVDVLYGFFL